MSFVLPSKDSKIAQSMLENKVLISRMADSNVSVATNDYIIGFEPGEMNSIEGVQLLDSSAAAVVVVPIASAVLSDENTSGANDTLTIDLGVAPQAVDTVIIFYKS